MREVVKRTARAILLDDEDRLVLIKRTKPGATPYWITPGGGVEPGDTTVAEGLRREVLEELGLPCEISVAPETATTDRAVPVDAHDPHVVGHSASERFDERDVVTPLLECRPSHWPHHSLRASHDHAIS